jgi:hypothetical protein
MSSTVCLNSVSVGVPGPYVLVGHARIGDRLSVIPEPGAVHLFDQDTGLRLPTDPIERAPEFELLGDVLA